MNNIFFEATDLVEAVKWLLLLLLGLGLAYYRTSARLQSVIAYMITEAERVYGDRFRGSTKFKWVCDTLHGILPAPLRVIITRPMIERLVQRTFDTMAAYAKMQLDRLLDSTMPDIERTGDSSCLK